MDIPRPFFFIQFAKSASLGWHGTSFGNIPQGLQKIRGIGYQFFGWTAVAATYSNWTDMLVRNNHTKFQSSKFLTNDTSTSGEIIGCSRHWRTTNLQGTVDSVTQAESKHFWNHLPSRHLCPWYSRTNKVKKQGLVIQWWTPMKSRTLCLPQVHTDFYQWHKDNQERVFQFLKPLTKNVRQPHPISAPLWPTWGIQSSWQYSYPLAQHDNWSRVGCLYTTPSMFGKF